MLYDVVLGGVLSATFIPVFVDRLANKEESEAFESISAVVTVSVVVLLVTTVAALVAAPYLIDALTALDTHAPAAHVHRVVLERQVATTFLRWFVIQIAAYGLFALGAALLNTRRRFVAVAWAPIVNNLVCIGILVWFGLWAGHGAVAGQRRAAPHVAAGPPRPRAPRSAWSSRAWPSCPACARPTWACSRWRWNLRDDALRAVARLGAWTFGFVVANQVALFVVTVLAGSVAGPDPVSSYTYAYAFFQLPYGIIAVTVMSVVTPDLAEKWSTDQTGAFLHRMTRRPARRARPHHPRRRRHAPPGQPGRGPAARQRPQHARPDGDDRRRAGHVRPRAAGVLRLPLPRPGPAVDAAHQGRLLPLPRRERAQRRPGPRPRPPARRPWPRPLPLHRLHGRRRAWPWPSSASGSVAWPSRRDLGAAVARRRGRRSPWPSSCWSSPTSRGRRASSACWPGWSAPSWPAASPSPRSWSGWAGATTRRRRPPPAARPPSPFAAPRPRSSPRV